MNIEQMIVELEQDMTTIARCARPLTEKWRLRKEDLKELDRQLSPEQRKRLADASNDLHQAMGRFDT